MPSSDFIPEGGRPLKPASERPETRTEFRNMTSVAHFEAEVQVSHNAQVRFDERWYGPAAAVLGRLKECLHYSPDSNTFGCAGPTHYTARPRIHLFDAARAALPALRELQEERDRLRQDLDASLVREAVWSGEFHDQRSDPDEGALQRLAALPERTEVETREFVRLSALLFEKENESLRIEGDALRVTVENLRAQLKAAEEELERIREWKS